MEEISPGPAPAGYARAAPGRAPVGFRATALSGYRRRKRRRPASAKPCSGFFLLQNLTALVHAGLEVEVVRAAQFAGILVLGIGRLLQGIRRAAHATPRGRCFSTGNGHVGVLLRALSEASSGKPDG